MYIWFCFFINDCFYLTEYNTRCYIVSFQKNGFVRVQNFGDISNDDNNIFCVIPLSTYLNESEVCHRTTMSGAFDRSIYDGNIILLKISEENDRHRYVYIGGDMICSFLTHDNKYKYISNIGINLTPFSVAIGEENVYFLTPHFKFIKREKYNDNELLKSNGNSVDLFDYHKLNCGDDLFRKLRKYKIHSDYNF